MNKDKEGLIGGILIIGLRNKIEVKENSKGLQDRGKYKVLFCSTLI